MELVRRVYAIAKSLPADERYALADQLRRAVVSIPSNIAEGNGRAGNKDYSHFLAIARGSLYESLTQIDIAVSLNYIQPQPEVYSLAAEIGAMLGAMLRKFGSI